MEDDKMTLAEFRKLSFNYRARCLWLHGSRMTTKVISSVAFSLYQLEDFFVEVIYNRDTHEIETIEGFSDAEHLMDYVEDIHLGNLF